MTTKKLLEKVTSSFEEKYKSIPVLTFSPGRINLIGEHTDYNDGFVFPAAIDKGIVSGIQKNDRSTCSVYALDAKTIYEFDKNGDPNKRYLTSDFDWDKDGKRIVLQVAPVDAKTGRPQL